MKIDEKRVAVNYDAPYYDNVRIWFGRKENGKQMHLRHEVTIEEYKPGFNSEPSFTIEKGEAQQLMDELYRAGFRPSEGEGTGGHIKALKDHLKDMRDIAFKCLNPPVVYDPTDLRDPEEKWRGPRL